MRGDDGLALNSAYHSLFADFFHTLMRGNDAKESP